jgi:hypothetical protein
MAKADAEKWWPLIKDFGIKAPACGWRKPRISQNMFVY